MMQRWSEHKKDCLLEKSKTYNCLLYKTMRQHGVDKWKIELYERFPCSNRTELRKKEGDIIKQIGTLNGKVAGRGKKEYSEENAEYLKEYKKKYAEENKEKLKQYREENKERFNERKRMNWKPLTGEKQEAHKAYCKEYHLKNAVVEREKYKKFYEENRDRLNERRRERRRIKKEAMGAASNEKKESDELVEDIGRLAINQKNETD
ncbi:hypothetical protein GUITHDRAFT_115554 [Guillardia theta CCMP2712]|uniref:GIY-YIG domain-containing protein n=1 Tax=Guillardia theta (strain CCMP2712) TaxID=905079 RepID=L1IQW3_GUITC|nr:hypothetical protein GUITHDRAFT_115554 [Guillardia theta CCMP2712]EKX38210.1 hypothetical protein GUITHDRAFT_115554 [Guillardia theta CCMP2712]|eukprot:XP_005825190.1 hypothetical protein GUITHDRAFT_115554 [Guillardia theta CCMP2712]